MNASLWKRQSSAGVSPLGIVKREGDLYTFLAPPVRKRYRIELEVYEARPDSWCHKKGDKFLYPQDWGRICPWLRGSLNDVVRILEYGVTLPWKYENTPYEKVIDPNGVTTEYIRCPDPTANLVVKITRTLVAEAPK